MNLFITGTDTDSGKTTVSSWICSHVKTKYWKIIQTGDDSDSNTVKYFAPNTEIIPEIYKLKAPLSAYDASKLENTIINTNKFNISEDKIIIEGAGGIFVPITDNYLMIDAIKNTNSKALIVSRSKLGMINHILLTVFALRAKEIPIIGIVISGNVENNIKQTIELFSKTKVLAILPESNNLIETFNNIKVPQEIMEVLL
ncbi:MAG: dethiobiotin synthase [Alphaproteobacteria bacterium]|nr:dethiobiotin synthase [Alphaproteobacteria bacterium]